MRKKLQVSSRFWLSMSGIILLIVTMVTIILFLLNGTTATSDEHAADRTKSLSCEADNIDYPIFGQTSTNNNIKVNSIFNNDKITTISLIYQAQFADKNAMTEGWIALSKAIEERYANDELNIDSLNMKFSDLENNKLQMSLYAEGNMIKNVTYKYFMLEDLSTESGYTLETAEQIFEKQDFVCIIIDNK